MRSAKPVLLARSVILFSTLACFTLSSVFGQALESAAPRPRPVSGELVIPLHSGRITDEQDHGSRQVVINIQDLHCNPEVQKNISAILAALDARFTLKKVYVEGGRGDIDTSWLSGLRTRELKKEIMENLLQDGRLTGAEYYSAVSNRPDLLKGLEDESAHKANIVRFGKILERRDFVSARVGAMERELGRLKARYLGPRNRELSRLIERYRAGRISSDKYYRTLSKYVAMIHDDPGKFGGVVPISLDDHPEIKKYLESTENRRAVSPARLLYEERRLEEDLRLAFSRDIRELEISFLADSFVYFKDFTRNRLAAGDYEYFGGRLGKFRAIWSAYASGDSMPEIEPDLKLLDEFYRANCRRNEYFLANIAELGNAGAGGEAADVIVVVTGGFHSEGLRNLLNERGISSLTIVPAITKDTGPSREVYHRLAMEQASRPGKGSGTAPAAPPVSLALGLASQMTTEEQFKMEIRAANRMLKAAGPVDRARLVDEIMNNAGITASYDPGSGRITFDSGAVIKLAEKKGRIAASGVRKGEGAVPKPAAGPLPGKKSAPRLNLPGSVRTYARPFMINLDGNSGSGKSYVAEKIARRTGAVYFSTGKIFRLVAYLAARSGEINPSGDPLDLSSVPVEKIEKLASGLDISRFGYRYIEGDLRYFYDDQDVTDAFYDQRLSRNAAFAARQEPVHRTVLRKIREHVSGLMSSGYSVVMEGKDAANGKWAESDARIFLKTDEQAAAAYRSGRYLAAGGLKANLRQVYFDVLGDEATEIEFEKLTDIEVGKKISDTLLKSQIENSERGYAPPEGAIVIESGSDMWKYPAETLFEKAFAVVQDKAGLSFALEDLSLKDAPGRLGDRQAESLLASQIGKTVKIGDTGLVVEVPLNETDVYLTDGMLGALLARSVASLPERQREELKRKGRKIRIAYVPEASTGELFEYGDGYVLVNSAFRRLRREIFAGDKRLAEMLFITGITRGLRKGLGEDFQWNNGVFAALARENGIPGQAVESFIRRYAALTGREGTGSTPAAPVTVCVSDPHGEFDHLVGVLSVALGYHFTPDNVFEELDLMAGSFNRAGVKVVIDGDIPDRGPQVNKTFKLIRKLVDTGVGEYVTGNHDMLAFMNLLGLHLPFYENYRGINEDYVGYCGGEGGEEYQNISRLLEAKRKAGVQGVHNIHYWAERARRYMNFADKRQKSRQDPENAEGLQAVAVFREAFEEMYGFKLDDKKGKDVLNKPELDADGKFFYQKNGNEAHKEKLFAWWKKIMGRNMSVLVYTGSRAVDKMSIRWWEDRLEELDGFLGEELSRHPSHAEDWKTVRVSVERIIDEQKREMARRWEKGEWEWAVIDAIMYRNYESVEWYAMDWVYHKGWGGLKGEESEKGFLKQINEKLGASGNEVTYNTANYLGNIRIQEIRKFYMENFRLFAKDAFGNVFCHGFLPIDEEGDVCIGMADERGIVTNRGPDGKMIKGIWYKGVHYTGPAVFDCFDRISEDIRKFRYGIDGLADIHEALSLVMYIYADATTRIRHGDIKKYAGIGFDTIYRKLGIRRMFNGHNPVDKMADAGVGAVEFGAGGSILAQSDFNFAPYYGHVGGAYVISPRGMDAVYYKAGSEKLGRISLFDSNIYPDEILTLAGETVPAGKIAHRLADMAGKSAGDLRAEMPEPAEAARLYAQETRSDWGLWSRKGDALYFAVTIEENIASFLKTYYAYYAANPPAADAVKRIKEYLSIDYGGVGERDIIAELKEKKRGTAARKYAGGSGGTPTVGHVTRYEDYYENAGALAAKPGIRHVWFVDLQEGARESAGKPGMKVVINGRVVKTWISDAGGSRAYLMDLHSAGIPEAEYAEALSAGAARITRAAAGTDNVPGIAGERAPDMVVSREQAAGAVKEDFSKQGINKPLFADAAIFDGMDDPGPAVEKMLVRHSAVSAVMAENKILKMDITDIRDFISSLTVFNAVGNGQMMVDWDIFAKAMDAKKTDEGRMEMALKDARAHGVAVHCQYRPADPGAAPGTVKKLYRLGFQGVSLDLTGLADSDAQAVVEALKNYPLTAVKARAGVKARARLVSVALNEIKTARFSPDDVIDLSIPRGLTEDEMRGCMRYLPLANTVIFHSADAASLIGGTRDILDKKILASLLDSFLSFGISSIDTAEKARRLGYKWDPRDLPALLPGDDGRKQLVLLRAGYVITLDAIKAGVSDAIREQAESFTDAELKKAFLGAIAEKMLVREKLAALDAGLGAAYATGEYAIKNPLHEEMLGAALARLSGLGPDGTAEEKAAYDAIRKDLRANANSLLAGFGVDPGRPGLASAVIDILPPEMLFEHSAGGTVDGTSGSLDISTTRALLGAA